MTRAAIDAKTGGSTPRVGRTVTRSFPRLVAPGSRKISHADPARLDLSSIYQGVSRGRRGFGAGSHEARSDVDPGKGIALTTGVDPRSITLAASELFEQGHFPGVVAVCSDALADSIEHVELRIIMARALAALRKDDQARRQLGLILQADPNSAIAFHLLGEIAFRNDDLDSAEIYFCEATRLNEHDEGARIWLELVQSMKRSPDGHAQVQADSSSVYDSDQPLILTPKHPMPVSGHWDSGQLVLPRKKRRRRFARGTGRQRAAQDSGSNSRPRSSSRRSLTQRGVGARSRAGAIDNSNLARSSFRSGTIDTGVVIPRVIFESADRSSDTSVDPSPSVRQSARKSLDKSPDKSPDMQVRARSASDSTRVGRLKSRPLSRRGRQASERLASVPPPIPGVPAADRFGGYLVANGLLTGDQLACALKHHESSKMRVGEAAVVLGYVSQQKMDWAALAFHCRRD